MKDNITAMTENIVRFFEQTSLREYIKKTWFYNENCFVVDFEYKDVKFALDFTANQTVLNVDFVLRTDCSFLPKKVLKKKKEFHLVLF